MRDDEGADRGTDSDSFCDDEGADRGTDPDSFCGD
ncbi:hypothetical protein PF007_g29386 [Phytophthora fragariae]|uniref:Uncharacterized protein n=1 Tax=Phytophthora fragariae TaxID=53985 RepID=A0A6A3PN60_9STRA|nr:hypothetical protein PF011_g29622 [Phytophthora fragariae]KAE9063911.1 hypothetical protein PF007_g29386 [Phytophthora fragariae]KAE9168240.1 hypothetical protein PF004_g28571 [Phytophthora fragariae]